MRIVEVKSKRERQQFCDVNARMNAGNPNYIRPLDNEVEDTFDPAKNKSFQYGEAARWLLLDDRGNTAGRIAAFTNTKYANLGTDFPVGGVGFFDCIDNAEAACMLFDTAQKWLTGKGMEGMDGPINFGDRDKWWGLMIEGFEKAPVYGMSFNPPYYDKLFEGCGFRNFYNQYYFAMDVDAPLPPRFEERYKKFASKPGYAARHIDIRNLEKHAQEFSEVYNAAWAQHGEEKEISPKQVMALFNKMKPIMDERLIWFAYYKEEPIAMWINIPDLNEYFKHFNGRFGLWQKLRLLWMKKTGQCKKFTGVAFGIIPKFQALGIDSFMIYSGGLLIQHKGWYHTYEMGWSGDWNPKMLNVYRSLGASQSRHLVTYRKLFTDRPFERHPVMEYER